MRRQLHGRLLLWSCALALLVLVTGCGGSKKLFGGASGPAASEAPTARGQVSVAVEWPGQPPPGEVSRERLIPYAANSVDVTIRDTSANEVGRKPLKKEAGQVSSHTFTLKAGSYTMVGRARTGEDGTGDLLAEGAQSFEVEPGKTVAVRLKLVSVVDHVEITSTKIGFGRVSTLTATPVAQDGSVVLVSGAKPEWSVDKPEALHLVSPQAVTRRARAEAPMSRTVVGKATADQVTVTVTVPIGTENGQVVKATSQAKVKVPPSYADLGGAREHGFDDRLYQLGYGYGTQEAVLKSCPFVLPAHPDRFSGIAERVTSGDPVEDFSMGWDEESSRTESGASFDVEATARYLTNKISFGATWNQSKAEDSYSLTFQVHKTLDFRKYWIHPSLLKLSDEAAELLAASPADFRAMYGDRVTIGERRWSYATCRLSRRFSSLQEAESEGYKVRGEGKFGAVGWSAAANYGEVMKKAFKSEQTWVLLKTNAPGSSEIQRKMAQNPQDVDGIIAQFGNVLPLVAKAKPVAYGFVTVPVEWVLPSCTGQVPPTPMELKLRRELTLWNKLDAMERRLTYIDDSRGDIYAYLGATRLAELLESRNQVRAQANRILERLPALLEGKDPGELPEELERIPAVRWPNPRIEGIFGQLWEGIWVPAGSIHAYAINYCIRVHDCGDILDEAGQPYHFLCGPSVRRKVWSANSSRPQCETRQLADGSWEFYVHNRYYDPFPNPDFAWNRYSWLPPNSPFRIVVGSDANRPIATLDLPMQRLTGHIDLGWLARPW